MKISLTIILAALLSVPLMSQTADENNALLNGIVTDYSGKPMVNEKVTFYALNKKTISRATSNAQGKFKILLPEGDTYSVKLMAFDEDVVFSEIEVPNADGIFEFDYQIKYELPQSYILDNVYFDTGKATLKPASYPSLNNLVKVLKAKKTLVIEIGGHTDNVGSDASNQALSQRRADSVKKYVVSKGVAAARIKTKGYGPTQPIDSNETSEGRQKNRRTQITILKQ